MDFLFSILAFAVILIPAIIIHELGHFVAAKMVGINVLEFGVGFPPRAMRLFTWGETEFTLNWLPIGGFVRPLGEDMVGPQLDTYPEEDADYEGEEKPKHVSYITEREELMARGVPEDKLLSVNEAKPLPRIWFMAAGATFNVLSAIIFFIITALFGIPMEQGARVMIADVPANSVFSQANVTSGDAIELVNGEYFGTHHDFFQIWLNSNETLELTMRHPDDFADESLAGQRYVISVQAPSASELQASVLVTQVLADSPAYESGLQAGDRILSANGTSMSIENPVGTLVQLTDEFAGQELALVIMRGSNQISLTLIPRENPAPNQGRIGIGIASQWRTNDGITFQNANPQVEYIPQSFDKAISYGFNRVFMVLQMIWELPGQIISGAISPEQARPVSVVGISQLGGRFLQQNINNGSPWMILDFIALISIFLGITNLLPIPPLDGGRILFVIFEIVLGKPVSPKVENMVNRIGLVIMLILGVAVIILDIVNPLVIP